jgi:hypothetical protein
MTHDDLTVDDVRKMAADIGMTRLDDTQLQELLRSTRAARARRASLETNSLTYADEPAHLFDLNKADQ